MDERSVPSLKGEKVLDLNPTHAEDVSIGNM